MNTPIQGLCEAAADRWHVPALAVSLAAGDSTTTCTVGCDAGTLFRIASVTKPVTALLACSLLDLDAPTAVWPDDVLVRDLLAHTSGFDCELAERDLSRFGAGDDALAAAVAELRTVRRLAGTGEIWSYANTGFWLAGHLAAERAGATFEDAVASAVLSPFGLERTSFGEPDLAGTGPDAGEGPYPRARRPSGGLVSCVDDVLRLGRRLLASPALRQMAVVHGRPIRGVYGLGLFGERCGGVDVWGHSGSYDGFQSSLLVVPAADAVFAGLTNAGTGAKALYEIEDSFLERVTGARRREATFVDLPLAERAAFAGRYANSDESYEIRVEADGIALTSGDEEVYLRPIGDRTFEVPDGLHVRERVDFPAPGFARAGSRLAERVG